jgi:two-component system, OmpR family, response regulator AdeR
MTVKHTPVVLVVEDDVDIAMLVSYALEDSNCTVVRARDGERAIELAAEQAFDLVLLDARLPRMNGEQVAEHLNLMSNPPAVILFSASADLATLATRIGAIDYIRKPFDLDDLTERVERVIARRDGEPA